MRTLRPLFRPVALAQFGAPPGAWERRGSAEPRPDDGAVNRGRASGAPLPALAEPLAVSTQAARALRVGHDGRMTHRGVSRGILAGLFLVFVASAQQPPVAPPTSLLATDTLVIRGRLLDAESGEPLPRGTAVLTGHQSTGYSLAWGVGDWADPPEQTTRDDGRFEFTLRVPASFEAVDRARYHLKVTHPHNLAWFAHGSFHAAMRTGLVDYGDIRLPIGVRPRVRCVDTQGVRQAGVVLNLTCADRGSATTPGPAGTAAWLLGGAYGATDIDGQLHVDHPLPAGSYITIEPNGPVITVPLATAHEQHVELVVAGAPPGAAANVLVEVVAGGEPPLSGFVRPYTADSQLDRASPGPCVVASARADAQGHVVVRVPELGPVHVRCSGFGVQPCVLAANLRPQQPLRVELVRGCRLSGSLGPVDSLAHLDPGHDPKRSGSIYDYAGWQRPTLTVSFADGSGRREDVPIEADGTFVCDGLPPGEVEVALQLVQRARNARERRTSSQLLGTFVVDPDTPRIVELTLPPDLHAPAAGAAGGTSR